MTSCSGYLNDQAQLRERHVNKLTAWHAAGSIVRCELPKNRLPSAVAYGLVVGVS